MGSPVVVSPPVLAAESGSDVGSSTPVVVTGPVVVVAGAVGVTGNVATGGGSIGAAPTGGGVDTGGVTGFVAVGGGFCGKSPMGGGTAGLVVVLGVTGVDVLVDVEATTGLLDVPVSVSPPHAVSVNPPSRAVATSVAEESVDESTARLESGAAKDKEE